MIIFLKLKTVGTIIFFMAGSIMAGSETTLVNIDHSSERALAQHILKATGVRGGLIVHVGCGDGRLTAELHTGDSYIVHALDENTKNVGKAREHIRSRGKYGTITVMYWTRRELPYAENMVNLLISENLGAIPMEEVMRALVPQGAAYIKNGATWTKTVKPWPNDIDEWTHWLHSPDGNAVADDKVVGPPKHMQWTAGPMWSRHHDTVPSTSAMVSSHGRIFAIVDEAPAGIDGSLPDRWFLVARDAFNGILLWKRPMPQWGWQQWSGKWLGRFNQPTQLAKRLVAIDDTVYVTLGFNAPLTAIDAATGRIIKTYDGTAGTDEILYHEGRLILSVNKVSQKPKNNKSPAVRKSVCVIEADSGKLLWKKGDYQGLRARADGGEPFGRISVAVGDGQLFMMDRNAVVSLNLATGEEMWRTPRPEVPEFLALFGTRMNDMCVMLYSNGTLLYAQPEMEKRDPWHSIPGSLYALSAKDGKQLWKRRYGGWMHFGQPDVFVIDGLVWIHEHKEIVEGKGKSRHYIPDQDKLTYSVIGLDPKTGDIKQRFSTHETFNVGHHHRCYRNKATTRFLLTSRRGVEFLNLDTGKNLLHHWARGACLYGILPCNGLLYLTPHPCECFIASKLNGYFALAPENAHKQSSRKKDKGPRLIRGPAFTDGQSKGISPGADDWPTFRHDARRSGSTKSAVPADLKPLWQTNIGGKISPVVVANGKLFVTSIDEHRVIAFDAANGTEAWSFTAAGRVDTPPTVYRHLVLFGSADGWVYCLRASDGECAWRFRAAPDSRLIGAFGQLESAWPVHGSILVEDDVAYFAAGRSSYLDEGIYVYALGPQTGKVIEEQVIYSPDPQTGEMPPGDAFILPGALSDIMVSDGKSIYMRENRVFGDAGAGTKRIGNTVFSTAGFRDETWFNRTHWVVGTVSQAQLLIFDDQIAYGVSAYWDAKRKSFLHPGKQEYMLFASDFQSSPSRKPLKKNNFGRVGGNYETRWMVSVPICVKAMTIADKTLFIAGTPDVVDPSDPLGAFEGRKGARLWAVSASDGKKLKGYNLDALPVWDGMAAANGRLYLSTKNGSVLCFSGTIAAAQKSNVKKEGKKRDQQAIAEGNTAFALELYAKLKDQKKDENLFFSPYSISTALAMTWVGARGETEKQMAQTLCFPFDQDQMHPAFAALQKHLNAGGKKGGYKLHVANALWGQKGYDFLREFLERTDKYYSARLNEVDFVNETEKTRQRINAWVEKKTNNKIKNLIKKGVLQKLTRLVLTNAIYFKGDWAVKFKEKNTKTVPFHITAKKKVEAPMMYQMGDFKYAETDNLQILEMPYKGDDLSMVVLLPRGIDGLGGLEKALNRKTLKGYINRLHQREVRVFLPKFKMTSEFGLAGTLAAMGMPNAFTMAADFSGMNGRKDLYISAVVHKAFVEVNEEGTEAAAATGVVMTLKAMPTPPPVFRADHPFLFLIRDNHTGSILFLGRMMNPAKK